MFYLVFSFLFSIFLKNFCSCSTFSSCREVIEASNPDGDYNIRPIDGGNASTIICNNVNATHGRMLLGNNRESLHRVDKQYETM